MEDRRLLIKRNNHDDNDIDMNKEVLRTITGVVFWREVKKLAYIAGPMVAVTLSVYLLQIASVMIVGHLGQLALSSTSFAFSLATVTGFSVMQGLASALETLCGKAFGAGQYQKLIIQSYTAILCLIIVCFPLSVLWINMGYILSSLGQDPIISREAGKFLIWLIPSLFAYAILQPLVRYFQMQSYNFPLLISTGITFCVHLPLCWALVFKSGLHNIGAAVAIGISTWINVLILGVFIRYSIICAKTRAPFTMEIFKGINEFFLFAIPSAFMICLEWWSFELLVLFSGLLPNPQLETSVLAICLNTIAALYAIPYGLGAGASTRVSNELGAGNPQGARVAVFVVVIMALSGATIISGTIFVCRNVYGYTFSNEKEVIVYVTDMAPLITIIMDNLQGGLSGIARGFGWQHLGAYVNLAAFYLFGIRIAAALGFWLQLRGGLWIGIQAGAALQTILLFIITVCTNWEMQAIMARERLH
ncbi:protein DETOXIFICATION 12-like isoform X2 [Apium graveolens]|uniref:protein DETOXIFICATION 12-like isoform X2 n=1 Tax=Apium graveolens TaxID=4045 RepID=UPI003D7934C1